MIKPTMKEDIIKLVQASDEAPVYVCASRISAVMGNGSNYCVDLVVDGNRLDRLRVAGERHTTPESMIARLGWKI